MTDIELIESHIEFCTPEVRAALDRLSQGLADSEPVTDDDELIDRAARYAYECSKGQSPIGEIMVLKDHGALTDLANAIRKRRSTIRRLRHNSEPEGGR